MIPLQNSTDKNNIKNNLNDSEAFIIVCASHFYRTTDGYELMKRRCQKTLQLFQNDFPKIWHMAVNKFCGILAKSIRSIITSTYCFFLLFLPSLYLLSFFPAFLPLVLLLSLSLSLPHPFHSLFLRLLNSVYKIPVAKR